MSKSSNGFTYIMPDPVQHSSDGLYTISMLSKEFGVTLRAIRFYCDRKLISSVTETGHARIFDRYNVERLSLIQKAKALGLTLSEIGPLIVSHSKTKCPILKISDELIEAQIAQIERQRDAMLRQLQSLIVQGREAQGVRPADAKMALSA